jgi:archaellum component FlaC
MDEEIQSLRDAATNLAEIADQLGEIEGEVELPNLAKKVGAIQEAIDSLDKEIQDALEE